MKKSKPEPPQKKEFFHLLDLAVRKGERVGLQKPFSLLKSDVNKVSQQSQ